MAVRMIPINSGRLISLLASSAYQTFRPNQQIRSLITLPIEWKRPDKQPFWHPAKTGDGVQKLVVDMNETPEMVEQSKEFADADDTVKKLFSFHFLGRKYAMQRVKRRMVESVQNHAYDNASLEVRIAKNTAVIRNLLEHIHQPRGRDKKASDYLNSTIQKRRKLLKYMRQYDYKRFEWLLEKLDLRYTPEPEVKDDIERKKSIRKLTNKYCEDLKNRKLTEYREMLESQRADFLREKLDTLKWIRQEEIECGKEPTVSETDIQAAVDKLQQHLTEISSRPVILDESRNILTDV